MFQALRLNKPEYGYLFLGLLMAIAVGIIEPLFALVYSEMFEVSQPLAVSLVGPACLDVPRFELIPFSSIAAGLNDFHSG